MSELWLKMLVVCPLVFLAGMIDAIAGGGGLISLPAYLITGLPVHTAISTNKLSACMGTAVATARFARDGFIPWKLAAFCVVGALAGSSLGAELALRLDDGVFRLVMLVILPLTAFYVLRRHAFREDRPPYPFGKTLALSLAAALVIGVYDGFYGPGTGTFLLLLLTGVVHLPLRQANGVTKAINLATNAAALTVFLVNGTVLLPLGLTAGAFSIAGNYLGARFFEKGGARFARPVIIAVLAVFFVKMLVELLGS